MRATWSRKEKQHTLIFGKPFSSSLSQCPFASLRSPFSRRWNGSCVSFFNCFVAQKPITCSLLQTPRCLNYVPVWEKNKYNSHKKRVHGWGNLGFCLDFIGDCRQEANKNHKNAIKIRPTTSTFGFLSHGESKEGKGGAGKYYMAANSHCESLSSSDSGLTGARMNTRLPKNKTLLCISWGDLLVGHRFL